jgi:hypothetical protein
MPYSNINFDHIPPAMNVTAQFYDAEIRSEKGLRGEMRTDFVKLNRFLEKYSPMLQSKAIPYGIFKITDTYYDDNRKKLAIIIGQAYLPAPDKKTLVLGFATVSDYDDAGVRFEKTWFSKYSIVINNGQEIEFRVPAQEMSYKVSGRTYDYTRGYTYMIEKAKTGATQLKNIIKDYAREYLVEIRRLSKEYEAELLLDLTKKHCIKLNPEAKKWNYELIVNSSSSTKWERKEIQQVSNGNKLKDECGFYSQPFWFDGYMDEWVNHPDYRQCPEVEEDNDDDDYEDTTLDIKAQTFCRVKARDCFLYFAQNNQGIILLIAVTKISNFNESTMLADYIIPLID